MSIQMDTDHGPIDLPRLRVTREVPLWGILSVIAVCVGQAIANYYSQQRQANAWRLPAPHTVSAADVGATALGAVLCWLAALVVG